MTTFMISRKQSTKCKRRLSRSTTGNAAGSPLPEPNCVIGELGPAGVPYCSVARK
eukprot:CAMPEP_0172736038 /NCGR_PEP_ID=MMETSP1074-20121228/114024_1 /TAXON_ID=2916 /ORGANISM="Ceratium fusus, Strain PA161109" /LENGTH=54 /DNA_ID=CAMNT_0013565155 /DNA_START=228 /DNA_END=392 /DNA_ORIENTATION=+